MNQTIIEILSQGGMIGVGIVATFLAYKYFANKIGLDSIKNPKNHDFFSKLQYEKIAHIPGICLRYKGNLAPNRTKMFKNMLDDKFNKWNSNIFDMVNEAMNTKASGCELEMISNKYVKRIITDYEKCWKDSGINKKVIEKFSTWHNEHIKLLVITIGSICLGDSFNTLKEKVNAILEIHKVIIIITIVDVEKTLGEMNGELSGTKYKNLTLE